MNVIHKVKYEGNGSYKVESINIGLCIIDMRPRSIVEVHCLKGILSLLRSQLGPPDSQKAVVQIVYKFFPCDPFFSFWNHCAVKSHLNFDILDPQNRVQLISRNNFPTCSGVQRTILTTNSSDEIALDKVSRFSNDIWTVGHETSRAIYNRCIPLTEVSQLEKKSRKPMLGDIF